MPVEFGHYAHPACINNTSQYRGRETTTGEFFDAAEDFDDGGDVFEDEGDGNTSEGGAR